jgi:hypothetical protein
VAVVLTAVVILSAITPRTREREQKLVRQALMKKKEEKKMKRIVSTRESKRRKTIFKCQSWQRLL